MLVQVFALQGLLLVVPRENHQFVSRSVLCRRFDQDQVRIRQEFADYRFRDLRRDTPYNTYLRAGLTPTPIALPGLDSIRAALHPEESGALYFVSRGDGTHKFSNTLEEHNAAVRKYQLNRNK